VMNPLRRALTTALFMLTLLPGCNAMGPTAVRGAPLPYNEAIAATRDEQQLLNLVRLRYRDVPLFLDVGSLTTQYTFDSSLSASSTFVDGSAEDSPRFTTGGSVKWSEKPTVSYSPLQGEKFVKQLMAPVPLEILALLTHSGWSSGRVLRLAVQSMNGVPNAPTASGPTPARPPVYKDFRRLGGLIRELQQTGQAHVAISGAADGPRLGWTLRAGGTETAQAAEIRRILRLREGRTFYPMVAAYDDAQTADGDRIRVTPRSFLGILFYLSHAVEVPEEHSARGWVTNTTAADGTPFDWGEVTGDLLRVRTSSSKPDGAYVAIPYRGAWFYIDDANLESKTTFALLSYLFALQAGDRKSVTPALTLPIGG